jgi:hypothetical protein
VNLALAELIKLRTQKHAVKARLRYKGLILLKDCDFCRIEVPETGEIRLGPTLDRFFGENTSPQGVLCAVVKYPVRVGGGVRSWALFGDFLGGVKSTSSKCRVTI